MVRVNEQGYIERKTNWSKHGVDVPDCYRSWFMVRATKCNVGELNIFGTKITFPARYVGKKIRFKIEMKEDR